MLHNDPRDLIFKLNRDTRFSHDKSPYNTAFRAHISFGGKLPVPVGYGREHPQAEYLKFKSWYLENTWSVTPL